MYVLILTCFFIFPGCILEPDWGCKWDRDISDCFVKQYIR